MGNTNNNGALLTWLFIASLKELAFDWLTRLQPGTIRTFSNLESLFLARFFNDDMEVAVPTLLQTKQLKNEPAMVFIKRFIDSAL